MSKETETTMEDFFTADQSENGVKLDLEKPNGEKTEHYLVIRGIDSKAFKIGLMKAMRKAKEEFIVLKSKLPEGEKITDEQELEIQERKSIETTAALIASWSFPQKCTEANKIKLLKNAPHIQDVIEKFSTRRENFLIKPSSN